MVTYAIGDVHGCYTELMDLLNQIKQDITQNIYHSVKIVFLGDYIDRGPDSKAVIDLLITMKERSPHRIICLRGNHEQMMMDALPYSHLFNHHKMNHWLMNGGVKTLDSYGGMDNITDGHLEFMNSTEMYYDDGKYLFVHAGIDPAITLEEQTDEEFLWIRDRFLKWEDKYEHDRIVVHGHTPAKDVLVKHNRINVDSGCVFGYKLSCAVLEDGKAVRFLQVQKK